MSPNDDRAGNLTSEVDEFLSNFESAGVPRFAMSSVDESLLLYQGPITIEFDGEIKIPIATVRWEWRREPIILCSYESTEEQMIKGDVFEVLGSARKVSFDDIRVSAWMVPHESTSCGPQHQIKLRLIRPAIVGKVGRVKKVKLHLVNCPDLSDLPIRMATGGFTGSGRLKLQSADWNILIDQVPSHRELVNHLEKFGGQAITHVLEIARCDKADFEIDALDDSMKKFHSFFSFVTGTRPTVCLPSGYDEANIQLWEIWEACAPTEWSASSTWVTNRGHGQSIPGQVTRAFPRFIAASKDEQWYEAIAIAIDWWVQAKNKGLETALVLGQAALELLANTAFELSSPQHTTSKQWDRDTASDRICWLLEGLRIDTAIPPKLANLIAFEFADGNKFKNGPHALTELRNAIAHPKKQKRSKFGSIVDCLREEAAMMVVFFVEHAIISLIGFDGLANAEWTHGCSFNYGPSIARSPPQSDSSESAALM